ncbi:MAG: DUF2058 domain-containing protein [Pseudomonadales bacterium]
MSSSLRDQLVKAGLATAGQAKKAERDQQSKRRKNQAGGKNQSKNKSKGSDKQAGTQRPVEDNSPEAIAKARARQVRAEKASRDRAIAKLRNEKSAEKAKRAEIKQIITQNDLRAKAANDDDAPYNFVHGKKVKRIYVPKQQVDDLGAGRLVIVNNDGRYHIVTKAVAEQISKRDPKWIVAAHDPKAAAAADGADDEFYKQFEVPDDLDW